MCNEIQFLHSCGHAFSTPPRVFHCTEAILRSKDGVPQACHPRLRQTLPSRQLSGVDSEPCSGCKRAAIRNLIEETDALICDLLMDMDDEGDGKIVDLIKRIEETASERMNGTTDAKSDNNA